MGIGEVNGTHTIFRFGGSGGRHHRHVASAEHGPLPVKDGAACRREVVPRLDPAGLLLAETVVLDDAVVLLVRADLVERALIDANAEGI